MSIVLRLYSFRKLHTMPSKANSCPYANVFVCNPIQSNSYLFQILSYLCTTHTYTYIKILRPKCRHGDKFKQFDCCHTLCSIWNALKMWNEEANGKETKFNRKILHSSGITSDEKALHLMFIRIEWSLMIDRRQHPQLIY